jgi:hypothetical protein
MTAAPAERQATARVCMPDAAAASPAKTRATIAQLAWMSGVWVSTSGSEERWTPPAGGSMLGVARSLRNGVMIEFEFLCLVERGGGVVYQAMPNARTPATDFALTRIDHNSATFENPAHDFPKSIRYTLGADGTLEAVVSGDSTRRAQTFRFKRAQP